MHSGRIVLATMIVASIGVPAHAVAQERDQSATGVSLEELLRHAETRAPAMVVARSRLGLVREEE